MLIIKNLLLNFIVISLLFISVGCTDFRGHDGKNNDAKLEMFVFEDTLGSTTFHEVISDKFGPLFTELPNSKIRYEASRSAIWIKFRLVPPSTNGNYIELSSPHLHSVEYYKPTDDGKFERYLTGFLQNFDTRPVYSDNFTFPVAVNDQWHFIRIQSEHFLNTEIKLLTTDELTENLSNRILLNGTYTGLVLCILIIVLLYALISKEFHYLYYAGFILSMSAAIMVERGFYFQFLWPKHSNFNYYFLLIPYLVVINLLLFLKSVFQIHKFVGAIYNVSFWVLNITPLALTIYFLTINQYHQAFLITEFQSSTMSIVFPILSVVLYLVNNENRPSFLLILTGQIALSAHVAIFFLRQNGILPDTFYTENALVIGSVLEVCLFSAAISARQQSLTKKYHKLIALQNSELKIGIADRTKELENSLKEKENIMNIVVHDLRSPLVQTKALSSLIMQTATDLQMAKEMMLKIEITNNRGIQLIDELNTIANLENNETKLSMQEVEVSELLKPVINNFEDLAKLKNTSLVVSVVDTCVLLTHPPYLIRVVENILSNAVKFSPPGSTVYMVFENKADYEISIRDQGPGFSNEDLTKVFGKFQRLSALPTAGERSTGLGLYIAKLLSDKINVSILLESEPGKGSTFRIKFKPQLL